MGRKIFAVVGCPGCGCGGLFIGAAIAATMMAASHLDNDSKSWAMLIYGGIPGAIIGLILYSVILAMFKEQ